MDVLIGLIDSRYVSVVPELDARLAEIGVFISAENGFDTGAGDLNPDEDDIDTLAIVGLGVAGVLALLFVFLAVAYWIRVGR